MKTFIQTILLIFGSLFFGNTVSAQDSAENETIQPYYIQAKVRYLRNYHSTLEAENSHIQLDQAIERLRRRQNLGTGMIVGGYALMIGSFLPLFSSIDSSEDDNTSLYLFIGLIAAGALFRGIGELISPNMNDMLEYVNLNNHLNPDNPIELIIVPTLSLYSNDFVSGLNMEIRF